MDNIEELKDTKLDLLTISDYKIQNAVNLATSSKNSLVSFKNFYFKYGDSKDNKNTGVFALKNINLQINQGDIILLGGISGSGKSTLCNTIAGRIPFDISGFMSGEVNLLGKDIWDYKQEEISKEVSFVFQNSEEQLVTFTVFDEIAFTTENLCLNPNEIKKKVKEIAESLEISDLLNRSIFNLSGGEKQKVILAANLVISPKILILDEPLAFLDEKGEELLIKILSKLHNNNPNLSIIIVEHRLNPLIKIINKIVILNRHGELIFNGNPKNYSKFAEKQEIHYIRNNFSNPSSNFINGIKKTNIINKDNKNKNKNKNKKKIKNYGSKSIIEISNLSYSYPSDTNNQVFANLSLDIKMGEFLGIVGSNGSGKTTLLYLIARMLELDTGQIKFEGKNLNSIDLNKFIPKIGFIFQNPENQIFANTVKEEILFAPNNFFSTDKDKNWNSEKEKKILDDFIPLVGEYRKTNDQLLEQNPFCLSWGQKRRLNLASIFSYEPNLLLIDEPFIGQDNASVRRIFKILQDFNDLGRTIIIVSHDRGLLEENCSRLLDLDKIKKENLKYCSDKSDKPIQNDINSKNSKNSKNKLKRTNGKKKRKISRINLFLNETTQFSTNKKNWLHNLNPVLKMIILITFTFVLFYQSSIIFLTFCYVGILILAKTGEISIAKMIRQIRWLLMLSLIYIPLNTLFDANYSNNDDILFYFFTTKLPVRRLALYYSLRTGLLIIIFISTAIIFTRTTNPKDLVYSLIQIGVPYRYAFSFMIGLRYIPIIEKESNTIEIAQRLRGSSVQKGTSIKEIYNYIIQRISTLLISILRKAKTTAMTIETRGFGVNKKRTNLNKVEWKKNENICLLLYSLFVIFSIIVNSGYFFNIPTLK